MVSALVITALALAVKGKDAIRLGGVRRPEHRVLREGNGSTSSDGLLLIRTLRSSRRNASISRGRPMGAVYPVDEMAPPIPSAHPFVAVRRKAAQNQRPEGVHAARRAESR